LTIKIWEWEEITNKVIRLLGEMNGNPKCHLHIPKPRRGIYVLNIIIQGILEKEDVKEMDPKGTPKP
jgi:hypothetical protein